MEQPTTEPLTAFLVTHDASDSMQNSCITILTYTAAAMEVKMARGSITMVVVMVMVMVMVIVMAMVMVTMMLMMVMMMLMMMTKIYQRGVLSQVCERNLL